MSRIMVKKPVSSMDIKRRNRANTLRCILNCERISQTELTQRLALSLPTVLQNVKELSERGLVRKVGEYESTGGRKAKAYAPVRDAKLAVGLDLTQNHVSMVLIDLTGQVVRYTRKTQPFSMSGAYFQSLGNSFRDFIGESDAEQRILGVGVSLPGIIDRFEKHLHSHVLGVLDIPTAMFSEYIPYPCNFINDANAAGLAEIRGRTSTENLVYLSLSNSVGGAVLNNGKLYTGSNLRAGEFGHNTLVPKGRHCYCGKDGCVDAYCSAKVLSSHTNGSLPEFFDQLRHGNAELQKVWLEYLEYLSIVINNLYMTFDCEIIAGGYVGAFIEEFGQPLWELLRERNTFQRDASYLKACRYKLEAAAVGAASIQVEKFIREL